MQKNKIRARQKWLKPVKDFFYGVLEAWDLDFEDQAILVATADRLQRFHKCRLQILQDGQTFKVGELIKCHPLLAHEKQAYSNFLAGCKKLNLVEPEPKKPAHSPPKGSERYGN